MLRRTFNQMLAALAVGMLGAGGVKSQITPKVRIYKVNEADWIAAHSLEEAERYYLKETWLPADEAIEDSHELSEAALDRLQRWDEDPDDGPRKSFREALADDLQNGLKAPYFFASTEW